MNFRAKKVAWASTVRQAKLTPIEVFHCSTRKENAAWHDTWRGAKLKHQVAGEITFLIERILILFR